MANNYFLSFIAISVGIGLLMMWRNTQVYKFKQRLAALDLRVATTLLSEEITVTNHFNSWVNHDYDYYVVRPWIDLDHVYKDELVSAIKFMNEARRDYADMDL